MDNYFIIKTTHVLRMWNIIMIRNFQSLDVFLDSDFTKSRVCVKFLICLAGDFISKNIEETVRESASLDLMLINKWTRAEEMQSEDLHLRSGNWCQFSVRFHREQNSAVRSLKWQNHLHSPQESEFLFLHMVDNTWCCHFWNVFWI